MLHSMVFSTRQHLNAVALSELVNIVEIRTVRKLGVYTGGQTSGLTHVCLSSIVTINYESILLG